MSEAQRSQSPAERSVQLTNRDRRPSRVKTPRVNMTSPPADQTVGSVEERARLLTSTDSGDLATGRGFKYEWENFVGQIYQQLADVGAGPQAFQFDQTSASAVWTIDHGLSAYPTVVVVDGSGQQLLTEVHYPDDQTVVIVHGQPYSGTAYLRI